MHYFPSHHFVIFPFFTDQGSFALFYLDVLLSKEIYSLVCVKTRVLLTLRGEMRHKHWTVGQKCLSVPLAPDQGPTFMVMCHEMQ